MRSRTNGPDQPPLDEAPIDERPVDEAVVGLEPADEPPPCSLSHPDRSPLLQRVSRGLIDELTNDDRGSTVLAGIAAAVLVAVLVLFKSC